MISHGNTDQNHTFNLSRFMSAQDHIYDNALQELPRGLNTNCAITASGIFLP